jgi:hypothetical protein
MIAGRRSLLDQVNWAWLGAALLIGVLCLAAVVLPFWIGSWD